MMHPASEKQVAFIRRLAGERDVPGPVSVQLEATLDIGSASKLIEVLLRLPAKGQVTLDPGVYEKDGVVYVVKPNRDKTRLYAKRLVEISAQRVNEPWDRVSIEFEYDRGAIFKLRLEDKMDLERAKVLTLRYGRCINCGATLKAAVSVERGIGPVCVKSFRKLTPVAV